MLWEICFYSLFFFLSFSMFIPSLSVPYLPFISLSLLFFFLSLSLYLLVFVPSLIRLSPVFFPFFSSLSLSQSLSFWLFLPSFTFLSNIFPSFLSLSLSQFFLSFSLTIPSFINLLPFLHIFPSVFLPQSFPCSLFIYSFILLPSFLQSFSPSFPSLQRFLDCTRSKIS